MIAAIAKSRYVGFGFFAVSIARPQTNKSMPMTRKSPGFQFQPCPSTPVPIISCNVKGISSISPVPIAARIMLFVMFCIMI